MGKEGIFVEKEKLHLSIRVEILDLFYHAEDLLPDSLQGW